MCAALAVAALALVAGCKPSSTGAATGTIPTGSSAQNITVDGMSRTFRVYRPASLPSGAVPLVVVIHGALGSAQQAENDYGWDAEADKNHFIVAYPDGYKHTWAVTDTCCGPPAAKKINDVAFIGQVVSWVSGRTSVDTRRVYATGISNGGMMTYLLACDTKTFAAIGPDSATMLNACPSPAPLSVIHIHGTADPTIPYTGGPGRRDNNGTGPRPAELNGPPIPALNATWRGIDHCAEPQTSTSGAVTTSIATCPDTRAVELVTIAGAGHQWPGQPGPSAKVTKVLGLDPPFMGLDATGTIWQFFAAHPKPA